MDNLRTFIKDRQSEFESEALPPQIWENLKSSMTPVSKQPFTWSIGRLAAIAASFMAIGLMIGWTAFRSDNRIDSLAEIDPEFPETQVYYEQAIATNMQRLAKYTADTTWKMDLHQMEALMIDYQTALTENPKRSRDIIIQAMIQNYQTRLSFLEYMLGQLEKQSLYEQPDSVFIQNKHYESQNI